MSKLFDLVHFSEETAILDSKGVYTYNELFNTSEEIVKNIDQRTVCMILTSNTYASIAGYVGCLNNKIVPLLVDCQLRKDMLQNLIKLYKPSYIWCPVSRLEDISDDYTGVYTNNEYHLVKLQDNINALHEDLALLITTSGSTGSPKLVRQSYKNIKSNTEAITKYLGITSDERSITSLPMNYVYGLSLINTHLYMGASIVLTSLNCYTPKFWQLFNEMKATSFAGVPFMYEMMNKLNVLGSLELPFLKTMTQAGGRLSPELQNKFAEFAIKSGRKFFVMYGASEATARMAYLPCEKAADKLGSIGVAIPGGRFELIDENGKTITEDDRVGELVYYGDNVTLGYAYSESDLKKGDENNGKLFTGDIARRDSEGYYYIVGRKKRFIKIVGKRINLDELEERIKKETKKVDIACIGEDDRLNIYITDSEIQNNVNEFVNKVIGVSWGLFKTIIICEIPKSTSGKTLYGSLKIV